MLMFRIVGSLLVAGAALAGACEDAPMTVTVRGEDDWVAGGGCASLFHASEMAGCGAPGLPCVAIVSGEQLPCESCFLITYRHEKVEDPACRGGECPKYERTVLAKAGTKHSAPESEGLRVTMSYRGWEALCPFVCAAESKDTSQICVTSEDQCAFGAVESFRDSAGVMVAGAASRPFNLSGISWQAADCRSGLLTRNGCKGGEKYVGIPPMRSHRN